MKTTEELLETLKNKRKIEDFMKENLQEFSFDSLAKMFEYFIKQKGISKSEVIKRSGIERHYGYQILSGEKTPSRDKMLMMCIGIGLDFDEVQHALKSYTYGELYPREPRDAVLIFSIYHKKNIMETNALLYEQGLKILE